MSTTFNGTTIKSVIFNGTSVSSVTFNGTEVFGEWENHIFPNSSEKLSSSSLLGFGYAGLDQSHFIALLDNNESTANWAGGASLVSNESDRIGGSAYVAGFGILFPEEWGQIKINSFTFKDNAGTNTCRAFINQNRTFGSSCLYTKPQSDESYVVYDQLFGNMNPKTITPSTITPTRMFRFITSAPHSTPIIYWGGLYINYSIPKSCYQAWREKYFS